MAKKNNGIKYILYLLIFGVFFYYEYGLYKKYIQEKSIREMIKEEKTTEIEKAFLLRKENFYQDRQYKIEMEKLKKTDIVE